MLRALVVAGLLSVTGAAGAQARCPAPPGASAALADRTPEARVAFILHRARAMEASARVWSATFALGYLALTAGQLAALPATSDPGDRAVLAVGAASSMIGVASLAALPVRALVDLPELEELAPRAASGDCEALARVERILADDASAEDFGSSWLMHVGNVLFNLAIGAVLWLGYDELAGGLISAGVGIAVGEVQIFTKPTGLAAALASYREGTFEAPALTLAPRFDLSFAGLTLFGRFT